MSPLRGTAFVLPWASTQLAGLLQSFELPLTHDQLSVRGGGGGTGACRTYEAALGPWTAPWPMFCVKVTFFGSGRAR